MASLVTRRHALGLSQRALGDKLGVPRNTIARWERGDMRVARPELLELALSNLERSGSAPKAVAEVHVAGDLNPIGRLHADLSSFIGREAAITECHALLAQHRLITLTGAGGIGKSRLAAQVARAAAADFPHGVHLVELATLEDAGLLPRAVAEAIGIAERAGDSVLEMLIEALRPLKLLLLLDDCDRVVCAAGDLVHELLRNAPCLAILATSRQPLDVCGELIWRVPPLTLPSTDSNMAQIRESEAVRLFVDRAQSVSTSFRLTTANACDVADVCRQLDGIPLALELAAARLKAIGLHELNVRLEHGFELLSGGSHTAPTRQQTLRATIDWSYNLLSQPERILFRRLSVFAGGWCLNAAEYVVAIDPLAREDVLPLLEQLIDKSLVTSEERAGFVRHSMLEPLRDYACERLADSAEGDALRQRHYDWMLDTVAILDPTELTPDEVAARSVEVQNLRAALTWSIEAAHAEASLRLACAAGKVWNFRGHYAEGICWLRRARDLPGAADLPVQRARALKWIGTLTYGLGEMPVARAQLTEACELLACVEPESEPPLCSQLLGNIARACGDLDGALRQLREAEKAYQKLGLRFWEEICLFLIGSALFEQGDTVGSRAACERCLMLGGDSRFTLATSRARVILAYVADREGDRKRADRLARQALMELRSLSELPGVAIALRALSQFALEQQRLGPACAWLAEALEIAIKLADCMGLARTLETLACVLASYAPEQTAYLAGGAAALRDRTGTVPWPTEQARITRWYGLARRRIGAATFETEWRAGRAMTNAATIATGREFVAEALVAFAGEPKQAKSSLLTPRQQEVVALVARGLTNEQIAQELVISPATARAHVEHVLDRLDLHSRAQVAAWACAHEPVSLIRAEDAS